MAFNYTVSALFKHAELYKVNQSSPHSSNIKWFLWPASIIYDRYKLPVYKISWKIQPSFSNYVMDRTGLQLPRIRVGNINAIITHDYIKL